MQQFWYSGAKSVSVLVVISGLAQPILTTLASIAIAVAPLTAHTRHRMLRFQEVTLKLCLTTFFVEAVLLAIFSLTFYMSESVGPVEIDVVGEVTIKVKLGLVLFLAGLLVTCLIINILRGAHNALVAREAATSSGAREGDSSLLAADSGTYFPDGGAGGMGGFEDGAEATRFQSLSDMEGLEQHHRASRHDPSEAHRPVARRVAVFAIACLSLAAFGVFFHRSYISFHYQGTCGAAAFVVGSVKVKVKVKRARSEEVWRRKNGAEELHGIAELCRLRPSGGVPSNIFSTSSPPPRLPCSPQSIHHSRRQCPSCTDWKCLSPCRRVPTNARPCALCSLVRQGYLTEGGLKDGTHLNINLASLIRSVHENMCARMPSDRLPAVSDGLLILPFRCCRSLLSSLPSFAPYKLHNRPSPGRALPANREPSLLSPLTVVVMVATAARRNPTQSSSPSPRGGAWWSTPPWSSSSPPCKRSCPVSGCGGSGAFRRFLQPPPPLSPPPKRLPRKKEKKEKSRGEARLEGGKEGGATLGRLGPRMRTVVDFFYSCTRSVDELTNPSSEPWIRSLRESVSQSISQATQHDFLCSPHGDPAPLMVVRRRVDQAAVVVAWNH